MKIRSHVGNVVTEGALLVLNTLSFFASSLQ